MDRERRTEGWRDGEIGVSGRMEGHRTGKVKGWLSRLMNGEWVSGYLHGQMDSSMDERSHGQMEEGRWVGGLMDGPVAWSMGGGEGLEGRGNRDGEEHTGCFPGGGGPWSRPQRTEPALQEGHPHG